VFANSWVFSGGKQCAMMGDGDSVESDGTGKWNDAAMMIGRRCSRSRSINIVETLWKMNRPAHAVGTLLLRLD